MHSIKASLVLGCCLGITAICARAQNPKAGLWEVTSSMTWQQSSFSALMAGDANSPFGRRQPHDLSMHNARTD